MLTPPEAGHGNNGHRQLFHDGEVSRRGQYCANVKSILRDWLHDQVGHEQIHWVRLIALLMVFIIVSVGLGYLLQGLLNRIHVPLHRAWLAYLLVFGISLVVNLSLLPLPVAISFMIAAAAHWNPIIIALVGSLGATIGEFNGYLLGYVSKKVAIHKEVFGYATVHGWIHKYGMWAIAFLSFQPVIPFEIGGFIAGVAKMPVHQFLPALLLGKFPKYLILIYAGNWLIGLLPGIASP
jgi:uncharacterized membrane protein YdjX (TVP38/TMEM64 family)